MKRLLLETLKNNPGDRVPFWFMRQAGRYLPEYRNIRQTMPSFLDFCYTPDAAVEVTLQPIRRFKTDAAILFADILTIPDGLGQKVWFEKGVGPKLKAVHDKAGLSTLTFETLHDRVGPVYETVRRLRHTLPDDVTLIGFAGAPWTIATYMVEGGGSRDQGRAREAGYGDPDFFDSLLQLIVQATAEYLIRQIKAGADVVQIFDSWAAGLPEPVFKQWVIDPTKAIIDRVRAECPDTPIIGFPRLSGGLLNSYIRETGIDGVSLDTGVPLEWADKTIDQTVCLQGNLDPYLVVAGGEVMEKEAVRILETLSHRSHIFNLGHGFQPHTPPEHVATLSEIIRHFRRR